MFFLRTEIYTIKFVLRNNGEVVFQITSSPKKLVQEKLLPHKNTMLAPYLKNFGLLKVLGNDLI